MWLLLVTAEKGCRKVSRLSWKSKTYLGVCHRHSLFTNGKKKKTTLLWLLKIHTQRKSINVHTQYHWTQDNKIRAESYYQQIFMTCYTLNTNNCWMCPCKKKIVLVPLKEEMTTLLTWVCSQTIKITGLVGQHWENFWNYCLLTEKWSYIFSLFRGNFSISGPRTS